MKSLRFLTILLTVILSSCDKNQLDQPFADSEGEGLLQLGLSVDETLQIIQSKASEMPADVVPAADEFYVELYRFFKWNPQGKDESKIEPTWNRLYFNTYAEMFTSPDVVEEEVPEERTFVPLRVNGGSWKAVAFHGDSTACGFDKPYFRAETEFTVDGGLKEDGTPNVTVVNLEAKVENVRITVNYDETVSGSFYDCFVRFARIDTSASAGNAKNKKYKQILRYKKDETRDAYMMPTDSLQIQFMAQYEYNDEDSWKYATLDTLKVNPNDHLTINLSVNPRHGNLDVNITTDDNIVKESTEVEILEMWAPQDPPQIVAAGFTDGDHAVVEGDRSGNNATVSVLARGGLKNFFVKFESDYLAQAGIDIPLDVEIDLANPTAENQAHYEKLRAAGLNWQDDMLHSRRLTYLTMTSLFQRINELNPSLEVERNLFNISVKVVDEVDKVTEQSLSATAYPITQELVLNVGDVWAKKIVSPKLEVTRGVSSLYVLQVSTDGQQTWSDLKTYQSAKDNVLDFGTLDVTPATTYHYRTIYNNNPNLMSDVVTVTTESELQVGNPGFEEYHTQIMHVTPMGSIEGWGALDYSYDREWYLPYKSGETDPWWAVNSKKTMPDGHTAWTSNFCKNFPCTAYSTTRRSGEKSALIYAINVSDGNTDGTAIGTTVPGEIWIGTADNNGNHATDGHAFASRPAAFTFWYRYSPLSGETFSVEVVLYDNAGAEIGRADVTDGSVASEWTQMEMPIVYSNLTSKAAKIYVSFKSSVSPAVNIASTMEIAGKQQTAHMGSALRIDDIELVY